MRSVVGIDVDCVLNGIVEGGRRARERGKADEGNTVNAFTRMFVTVSGCVRCGLNWYLEPCQSLIRRLKMKTERNNALSDRTNN